MTTSLRRTRVLCTFAVLAALLCGCSKHRPPPPGPPAAATGVTLDAQGRLHAPDGKALKGCNLGNWLLLEMWMLDQKEIPDQDALLALLDRRFGRARRDQLMASYREGFITQRDFDLVRSFGFNLVRIPFHYGLLMDDKEPFVLRADAFRWLDAAVAMAEKAGLFVVLDLHGAPGGQSLDHSTGRTGQNQLWSSPARQDQTVWLWERIAEHFRASETVAAYDLLNEPYGDYRSDRHLQPLVQLMDRLVHAVRAIDPEHVLFLPGPQQGIELYGDPHARGWTRTGFTEHYYPGLHGSPPLLETHARFVSQKLRERTELTARLRVPFLVGEFNVVLDRLAAPELMRFYFDTFAQNGWAATMWSYKVLSKAGGMERDRWYLVKNQEPLPSLDFRTASFEEVATLFGSLGTMPLAVNESLRQALTNAPGPPPALTVWPPVLTTPPAIDTLPGWSAEDIGGALPGGQSLEKADAWRVYGGGSDIWNDHDQFRFISKPLDAEPATLSARAVSLTDGNPYAKAGLMVRHDNTPNSPHALLHLFPDGRLVFGWRDAPGATMREKTVVIAGWPLYLKLTTRGRELVASYSADGTNWIVAARREFGWLTDSCRAGVAVCAHENNEALATSVFSDVRLKKGAPP